MSHALARLQGKQEKSPENREVKVARAIGGISIL
jgi:hypothetical protein